MSDDSSAGSAADDSIRSESPKAIRHYFVDEAGDGTLFNRRKLVVVGNEGCSTHFILGLLDVAEPQKLEEEIPSLRSELMADPYLQHSSNVQR